MTELKETITYSIIILFDETESEREFGDKSQAW